MKALGIDWGIKGMGLALSDALRISVSPVDNYFFKVEYNYEEAKSVLEDIISSNNNTISEIVVGYPLTTLGNKSSQTNSVEEFTQKLTVDFPNIKVKLFDERMTTKLAKEKFGNRDDWKQKKDMYSACILLEDYISRSI